MNVQEEHDELESFSEYDIILGNLLKIDYEEDFSPPRPPPGYLKVKKHHTSYVRKSTLIQSIYYARQRVSTDRLSRFISERKRCLRRDDNIFAGHFAVFSINGYEQIVQVLGFRKLSGNKKNLSDDYFALKDRTVGAILCAYEIDINNKLSTCKAVSEPVSFDKFVRHVEPNELKIMLPLLSPSEPNQS